LGWQAADGVDWSRLFHAYGAATDTPTHLRALAGDDLAGQLAALDHLDSAVLHQGTVYPVTPVAVRVVAGLLHEPALRRAAPQGSVLLTIQRANWRSAFSAASTLRGARNVPSCRKYRWIVITACSAATCRRSHSAAATLPAPWPVSAAWPAGRSRDGCFLDRQHLADGVLVGVDQLRRPPVLLGCQSLARCR